MDPKRINNYNKFLSTLDSNPNVNLEKDAINILSTKFNTIDASNNKINDEKKETIDKSVKEINEKFEKNQHNSINFTGKNSFDKCCPDPNYYRDVNNSSNKAKLIFYIGGSSIMPLLQTKNPDKWNNDKQESKKKNDKNNKKNVETIVEIKETINIEEEIKLICPSLIKGQNPGSSVISNTIDSPNCSN